MYTRMFIYCIRLYAIIPYCVRSFRCPRCGGASSALAHVGAVIDIDTIVMIQCVIIYYECNHNVNNYYM